MPINYNSMANYYNANELIPIIGGELLKIRKGFNNEGERLLTFEQYLIEEMTGMTIGAEGCPTNISELTLRVPGLNSADITAVYRKIPANAFVTGQLDKLVGLDKFNFFISTSYDRKLEELIEAKKLIKPEPIMWNHEKKDALFINLNNETRKIVYLFGGVSKGYTAEEMSINDEDRLESLLSLSLTNSRNLSTLSDAFSFLEYLKNKVLLFIGNNFQDWFMRFMVRTLYSSPYKKDINKIYIVNDENTVLGFEKYFFEKYGINIIHDSPIGDVIDSLANIIQAEEVFKEVYKQTVFISYDRNYEPDIQCARKVNTGLRKRGINAWFDTSDLGITAHQKEIKKVIGSPDTAIFICILSKKLTDKAEADSYAKSIEWKTAEAKVNLLESQENTENQMKPFYIVPVTAEDLDKEYMNKLPGFISRINTTRCNDDNLLDKIEGLLKK